MKFTQWIGRLRRGLSRSDLLDALAAEQAEAVKQFSRAEDAEIESSRFREERDAIRRENVELKGKLRRQSEKTMAEWNRAESATKEIVDLKKQIEHHEAIIRSHDERIYAIQTSRGLTLIELEEAKGHITALIEVLHGLGGRIGCGLGKLPYTKAEADVILNADKFTKPDDTDEE